MKIMKSRVLGIFAAALMLVGLSAEKASANDGHLIGTIIGAATGAVLGSKIGKGNGKVAATAVGTLIGAAIGRDIAGQSTPSTRSNWPDPRPVYRSWPEPQQERQPVQPTVIHKTKIVKHVHVHERGHKRDRKYNKHHRTSKWQKRHNRKHRQVADNRRHNRFCDDYPRRCGTR
jgi:hypothetical protein